MAKLFTSYHFLAETKDGQRFQGYGNLIVEGNKPNSVEDIQGIQNACAEKVKHEYGAENASTSLIFWKELSAIVQTH